MDTLLFSESNDLFYSHLSEMIVDYLYIDDELYIIDSFGSICLFNAGYDNGDLDVYMSYIVNDDFQHTKVYDTVETYMGHNNDASSITVMTVGTNKTKSIGFAVYENREGTRKASIPREDSTKFSNRIRDKYINVVFEIKRGPLYKENRFFSIPYIKIKYRYSVI